MGIAIMMYFLNLVANMTETAEFLKYITPFGYCEGADIVTEGCLNITRAAVGICAGITGVIAAYWKYGRKDIH